MPASDQEQQPDAQQVEEAGRGVRRRERRPSVRATATASSNGHVGQVEQRPVGVAVLVVGREGAPQVAPVGELVGADHARVADVDHVPVGRVEADAEADEEERAIASQRHGTLSRSGSAGAAERLSPIHSSRASR